ncbi:MAG: hypothetical protein R2776_07095 [Flavobacteriaceae bacterium]
MKKLLIFFSLCVCNSGKAQYDAGPLYQTDITSEVLNQFKSHGSTRYVQKSKRKCIFGDCQNGQGVVQVDIELKISGTKYHNEIYIGGKFGNGRLNGLGYVLTATGNSEQSAIIKFLKKGDLEGAWMSNHLSTPSLKGEFTNDVITHGSIKNVFYDTQVPYRHQSSLGSLQCMDKGDMAFVRDQSMLTGTIKTRKDEIYMDFLGISQAVLSLRKRVQSKEYETDLVLEASAWPSLYAYRESNNGAATYFDRHPVFAGMGCTLTQLSDGRWQIRFSAGTAAPWNLEHTEMLSQLPTSQIPWQNGSYTGALNGSGQPNGFGSYKSDVISYTGFFQNGTLHGWGFFKMQDRMMLGEFVNNALMEGLHIGHRAETQAYMAHIVNGAFAEGRYFEKDCANMGVAYEGELNAAFIPNGDAIVDGKEGRYENGKYVGKSTNQVVADEQLKDKERAYWAKESPCGLPGEWVLPQDLPRHYGKVICTSDGKAATYSWIHPRAAYWQEAARTVNNKISDGGEYYISVNFPTVVPGNIQVQANSVVTKGEKLFVLRDVKFHDYYKKCGLCLGEGYCRIPKNDGNFSTISHYLIYRDDEKKGHVATDSNNHLKDNPKGLDYFMPTYALPCIKCGGMGYHIKGM